MVELSEKEAYKKSLTVEPEKFVLGELQSKDKKHSDMQQETYISFQKAIAELRAGKESLTKYLSNYYVEKITEHAFSKGISFEKHQIDPEIEELLDENIKKDLLKMHKSKVLTRKRLKRIFLHWQVQRQKSGGR